MAVLLALLSALSYGAGDFFGGLATRRAPPTAVVLRATGVGLAALLVASPFVGGALMARDAAIGVGAGIAVTVGLLLLYGGLARGTMSVVAPITAVLAAVVPMGVGLAAGERPGAAAWAGLPLALAAVVLLASEPAGDAGRRSVAPLELASAVAAGLGFGLFFVALDASSEESGLWPVIASHTTSVTLLGLLAVAARVARAAPGHAVTKGTGPLVVACGILDASAHALFVLASREGLLTLVAVLAALYPASTLLLARLVLGERLAGLQRIGVALAAGAVVLLTAA